MNFCKSVNSLYQNSYVQRLTDFPDWSEAKADLCKPAG